MANLSIYRGDTTTYTLTFTDGSSPVDITGWTIFFTVKEQTDTSTGDASAVISKTVTSHSDPTQGVTIVSLSSSDTDVAAGTYKYDFQYKTDAAAIKTIDLGSFTITDDVTKRTS